MTTRKQMRVIVAGCRTVTDYDYVKLSLDNILGDEDADIIIISGTAKGADTLGAKWALQTPYVQLVEMPAQWDRYGKSAGYRRNHDMACVATHLIAFWDNASKGTGNMIDIAKTRSIPTRVLPAASLRKFAPDDPTEEELDGLADAQQEELTSCDHSCGFEPDDDGSGSHMDSCYQCGQLFGKLSEKEQSTIEASRRQYHRQHHSPPLRRLTQKEYNAHKEEMRQRVLYGV